MIIEHAVALRGTIKVPGDKSISHRSVMLGSIAEGTTYVRGFLNSADCQATIACFRKMGIRIEDMRDPNGERVLAVYGKGLRGLSKSADMLDAMNSGTTTRLMAGILAGQPFDSFITGDASLRKRPMKRIIDPLTEMGCHIISANDDNCLPLKISGGNLHAIRYHSKVASAQVKSCVLLAALYAEDPTFFYEPSLSRNHTELMLGAFGANLKQRNDTRTGEKGVIIYPGTILRGQNITVPGDISSAAYFIAAGLLVPKSEIRLTGVGINETRDGILRVVKAMGGDVRVLNVHMEGREPVADLVVRSSDLKACSIGGDMIPALIDELPIIAVMAGRFINDNCIRNIFVIIIREDIPHIMRLGIFFRSAASLADDDDAKAVIKGRIAYIGHARDHKRRGLCEDIISEILHGSRFTESRVIHVTVFRTQTCGI